MVETACKEINSGELVCVRDGRKKGKERGRSYSDSALAMCTQTYLDVNCSSAPSDNHASTYFIFGEALEGRQYHHHYTEGGLNVIQDDEVRVQSLRVQLHNHLSKVGCPSSW